MYGPSGHKHEHQALFIFPSTTVVYLDFRSTCWVGPSPKMSTQPFRSSTNERSVLFPEGRSDCVPSSRPTDDRCSTSTENETTKTSTKTERTHTWAMTASKQPFLVLVYTYLLLKFSLWYCCSPCIGGADVTNHRRKHHIVWSNQRHPPHVPPILFLVADICISATCFKTTG